MFVYRLSARRQIHFRLNVPPVAAYLAREAGQGGHRRPPGAPLAPLRARPPPGGLGALRTEMVRSLLVARRLERFRLLGSDYLVTLDGSGHLALGDSPSAFTEGALTQTLADGRTLYYRMVLEAKLVTRSGLALSVEI